MYLNIMALGFMVGAFLNFVGKAITVFEFSVIILLSVIVGVLANIRDILKRRV